MSSSQTVKTHQIGLRDFLWGEAEVCSPVFPYSAALRAAKSVRQKSESLILVELYNSARTFFDKN